MNISDFEYISSIPRKYFKFPHSLISNYPAKHFLEATFSSSLFIVTNISSTYIMKVVTPTDSECLMNKV